MRISGNVVPYVSIQDRVVRKESKVKEENDVNDDKVANIKAMVDNGTYKIKLDDVAHKMARDLLDI